VETLVFVQENNSRGYKYATLPYQGKRAPCIFMRIIVYTHVYYKPDTRIRWSYAIRKDAQYGIKNPEYGTHYSRITNELEPRRVTPVEILIPDNC